MAYQELVGFEQGDSDGHQRVPMRPGVELERVKVPCVRLSRQEEQESGQLERPNNHRPQQRADQQNVEAMRTWSRMESHQARRWLAYLS